MAENDVDPVEPEPLAETKKLPQPDVDKSQYVVVADGTAATKPKRAENPVAKRLKPDTLTTDYVVVKDGAADEPVALPATPTEVIEPQPLAQQPNVVYRETPLPPKRRGNRAFGVLIAAGATVIFAVLFAFAVLLILRSIRGFATMSMLANYGYWVPVGVFLVSFLIVVLVINRAGWWAHIIGSFLVGAVAYFAGALLITSVTVFGLHQVSSVQEALVSPTIIAAAIIAREVALWAGVIVSIRGRRVVQHNRDERATFDSEQARNVH